MLCQSYPPQFDDRNKYFEVSGNYEKHIIIIIIIIIVVIVINLTVTFS
jgi:hypothetical protein